MPPRPTSDPDAAWLSTLTVLYVEDEKITRAALAEFLRRRVHRLVEAADGIEGLARFREERPALVITDIQMPGMDGLSMTESISRLDPAVPIVVTTAFEQIDYLERAIDVGVDRFVTKPVDLGKLEASLLACARRLRGEAAVARERERELHAARAREREVVGLLAGGMAHDFNNLLQSILANIELAAETAREGSEQRAILDDALRASEQATELGRHLAALSERSLGRFAWGALDPVARGALHGALAGSQVALQLRVADDLPPVWHDAETLGQALENLARNAREAMGDEGCLQVELGLREIADGEIAELHGGRHVQLTLHDSGPGIPAELLPRIFDPYFSTKPRGATRGMGLGLALCREHLAHGRFEEIRVIAHGMAGSGGAYGFDEITRIGRSLQVAARGQDARTCAHSMDELEAYVRRIHAAYGH